MLEHSKVSIDDTNIQMDLMRENEQLKQQIINLKNRRDTYQFLYNNIKDGVALCKYICDPKGNPKDLVFLEVNNSFEEMFHISGSEIIGKSFTKVINNFSYLDYDWFFACVSLAMQKGQALSRHAYIDTIDKWFSISIYYVRKELLIITFTDITDRKKSEEALGASENKYRTLVETIREGIAIIDRNNTIIYCNPALADILELHQEDIAGKNVFDFLPCNERHDLINCIRLYGQSGKIDQEISINLGENKIKTLSIHATPMVDEINGSYNGIITAVYDITDKKKAEKVAYYFAYHDGLTHLYNRAYFDEQMSIFAKNIDKYKPFSIVSIDVDGLKVINDILGHKAGDEALVAIAKLIKRSFKGNNIMARTGGDEFCVLLPNTHISSAEKRREYLAKLIHDHNKQDNMFYISMSIGIASTEDITNGDLYQVYQVSDSRMYCNKLDEVTISQDKMVNMMVNAVANKDFFRQEHIPNMVKMSELMAAKLNLSDSSRDDLIMLAKLHDVGKIAVPQEILYKPGPLTDEERSVIQRHSHIGYNILCRSKDLFNIAKLVLYHHEHWDGTGYPMSIKGNDIPIESRIIAILDAYDAMTNERPYRHSISEENAISELIRCSGTQFDPLLVQAFIEILREKQIDA